jgi:hypothetical protein
MGSLCVRNTNAPRTAWNDNQQSTVNDETCRDWILSLAAMMVDEESTDRKGSTRNAPEESVEERKWHDDVIYS